MGSKSKLRFVAHYTPMGSMTDEDKRAVVSAFFIAAGMPMSAELAKPIDAAKTWHGIQERKFRAEGKYYPPLESEQNANTNH